MPPYSEPAWSHDFHAGFFSKQTLLHDLNLQRNRHRRGERAFAIASFKAVHRTEIEARRAGGNYKPLHASLAVLTVTDEKRLLQLRP